MPIPDMEHMAEQYFVAITTFRVPCHLVPGQDTNKGCGCSPMSASLGYWDSLSRQSIIMYTRLYSPDQSCTMAELKDRYTLH